jgi:hypothetical protein
MTSIIDPVIESAGPPELISIRWDMPTATGIILVAASE